MACLSPIFKKAKKNGETLRLSLDCGQCVMCVKKRRQNWTFRLFEHLKDAKEAYFVTLTYNDDNLVYANDTPTLAYRDVQLYIKRLRKISKRADIKYYAVGEYGDKNKRPHYHLILYNVDQKSIMDAWRNNVGTSINPKYESKGIVHVGSVTQESIHYVTKYIHKNNQKNPPGTEHQKALMSKNLGYGYIKRTRKYHKETGNTFVTLPGGYKQPLPKYYANKIWEPLERQVLYKNQHAKRLREYAAETYLNLINQENWKAYYPVHLLAAQEIDEKQAKKIQFLEYITNKEAISKKV